MNKQESKLTQWAIEFLWLAIPFGVYIESKNYIYLFMLPLCLSCVIFGRLKIRAKSDAIIEHEKIIKYSKYEWQSGFMVFVLTAGIYIFNMT
ncbi:hypothetical protein RI845_12635 [Thalassotalea nanhaiensis]|uniref:Uncharacterized protein n=1 Tax=Thalassotalea nanhaiensis TaxID=3065648 RepID=A0ABY9TGG8_9GAMM|nr:hypothetical protein RI845_12635 [Colwelliaceae bacterium SQ345]